MTRLAWQNIDAPNLAPAIQGFANVTNLLQKALESASTNPMLENQIKQEELNAKIRKEKNEANTLAANRAINAKVAMSPSAQVLQQRLINGDILGEDYLDASPEVISGARTAVGDMLTNSLNQDKVNALVPDRNLAWLEQQYAGDPVGYQKALQSGQFLLPSTVNASPEAIRNLGSGLTTARTNYDNTYKQNQLEAKDSTNKRVDSIFGLALAGGGSETDIRNRGYSLANQSGFSGPELTELTNRYKSSGIGFADPVAQVPTTTGGKTATTPAANAIAGSIPIDNTGIDSGLNSAVLRNTYNNRPLPENINTLGDLFDNRQNEYFRGTDKELHTSTGPLQIIAGTFARHGEKIYGKNWREQSLNDPKVHYDIGESIFKETGGNVDKLIGQWDALKKLPRSTVEKIAKGPWSEAAPIIAAAESGSNSGAAKAMRQISNPDYTNSQISNVTSRASRAIAQFSADPLVLNYNALNKSNLTADQVAWDGVKTSVDFGTLNKDEMDLAARNIKRTIEYVQKQAGGNISPELAFAVAKQSFGDENFRILWLNSDLNLNTTKMNKIIKSLNDKGGIPDQANELTKMQGVFSKLESANNNVATLQQKLIDAKNNNGNNPYSDVVSKAESALDKALGIRTQIAQEIEKSSVFQPKENVTVEQELTNNNTIKGGGGSAIGDALAKQRQLDKQSNTTKDNTTTPPTVNNANNFVNSRQGNVSKKLAESLSTTDPSQVKPVAAPIAIPVKVDGKSGTGTTFALDNKTGQTVPVTPLKIDPNIKYQKPVTVVKADKSGGQKAVITYIGDGDGVNVDLLGNSAINNGNNLLTCRLDTIDAPETGGAPKKWSADQPFAREAQAKLQQLIASGNVTVIVTKPAAPAGEPKTYKNNYGRPLCKIEVEGQGVDKLMLQAGMAWLYRQYSGDANLMAAEDKARADKIGLWSQPNPQNPADYRHSFK